jgi:hypothetical protein
LSLNELARQIAMSTAMLATLRTPSTAIGISSAADPVQHAIEETLGLLSGWPAEDASALQAYHFSLTQLRAELP